MFIFLIPEQQQTLPTAVRRLPAGKLRAFVSCRLQRMENIHDLLCCMQHWFCLLPVGCWFTYCLAHTHFSSSSSSSRAGVQSDALLGLLLQHYVIIPSISSNVLNTHHSRHGNNGHMHEDRVKSPQFHKLPQQEGNTSGTKLENIFSCNWLQTDTKQPTAQAGGRLRPSGDQSVDWWSKIGAMLTFRPEKGDGFK